MPTGESSLYEYYFEPEEGVWISWNSKVPEYVHDPDLKFNDILVPTVDTVRAMWLLTLQVRIKRPVLLVGETGTSKTATTANFLRDMDKESHVSSRRHLTELITLIISRKGIFISIYQEVFTLRFVISSLSECHPLFKIII